MMDSWKEVVDPEDTGCLADNGERLLNLYAADELKVEVACLAKRTQSGLSAFGPRQNHETMHN